MSDQDQTPTEEKAVTTAKQADTPALWTAAQKEEMRPEPNMWVMGLRRPLKVYATPQPGMPGYYFVPATLAIPELGRGIFLTELAAWEAELRAAEIAIERDFALKNSIMERIAALKVLD